MYIYICIYSFIYIHYFTHIYYILYILYIYYLLFGCPTVYFGPLTRGRGQPHSPDINHCVLSIFDPKVTESVM